MAAVACTLSLLAGCSARLDRPGSGEIRFEAGSALLRDDATKSGTPKTGTAFTTDDQLSVFGYHSAASELITFGTEKPVTLGSGGAWTYAPSKIWEWSGNTDYYDFMAVYVYPYNGSLVATANPLSVTFHYDATSSQYDLMTAGHRRNANDPAPKAIVPLSFQHRLAAVRFVVTNDVGGQTFRLDACRFSSLIISADATSTFQDGSLRFSWSGNTRSSAAQLGSTPGNDLTQDNSEELPYDLMIPQRLDPLGSTPSLILSYTPKTGESTYGGQIDYTLPLADILIKNSSEAITEWKAGYIYTYNITIRIGGAVIVNVETTPWEEVNAETPGILI